jgi:lysophospholipase L1-like esterase
MNRLRLATLSVAVVLLTTLATSAPAAAANGNSDHTVYLSLGDSLSQGVQPDATGASVETNQGYADQLFQIEQSRFTDLHLFKMGCPGETTTTMIAGGICTYDLGSQLAEAVDFLNGHRNHMAFVTLDIGGNDLNNCAPIDPISGLPRVNPACIVAGFASIGANLPVIIAELKAADPNVIVGMKFYNPFLAVWLKGGVGQTLYQFAQGIGDHLNAELGVIYAGGSCHFDPLVGLVCVPGNGPVLPVADVATAFCTDCTNLVLYPSPPFPPNFFGPLNTLRICEWTWMCAPAPQGPNIHANQDGYGVMAQAFAAQL